MVVFPFYGILSEGEIFLLQFDLAHLAALALSVLSAWAWGAACQGLYIAKSWAGGFRRLS